MDPLKLADPEIAALVDQEVRRQDECIRLVASENYASAAVQQAVGSPLANKYSEGYPGKRYYEGQQVIDQVEALAVDRIKRLFGAEHANVQPYSGSPANQAVYFALLEPGDTVMGLGLPHGGHLTHGWQVNFSGRHYKAVQYSVRRDTELLDYDEIRQLAREHRPKLIIAGITAYPRVVDWSVFREVADEVGAYFMADIAHISGLVAAGLHPSPVPLADVVTSTTHKTLRGPRGGMILCKSAVAAQIDRAVFPGLQGGPHNNTTAGIAVAALEATTSDFAAYAQRVVDSARALGESLASRGFRLVTGGTDNHMLVVDVTARGVSGKQVSKALDRAGIVCNFNSIPYDPRKPFDPSGIRIGTAAMASRGIGADSMPVLAGWIDRVVGAIDDEAAIASVRAEVIEFTRAFPAPGLAQ
ncbi:MAG: serine hydroxymethyltransferase [Myxococcales bacterium]|nr:serine hydroxymethyltransferase [Myxococcales bacterium]MCB9532942.1 serine hydroxymethyltransferase [Myxococcales bacterium]